MHHLVARIVSCVLSATLALSGVALFGCSEQSDSSKGATPSVRIGTMPTEDMLPGWVALSNGYFEQCGVNVTIEVFDSAQSLSAAISASQVDMAMTDLMRAVKLCESGSAVEVQWITLGSDASQGRFGLLAPADPPYDDLAGLADYLASEEGSAQSGVGVAANTVPEYVFDRLATAQGIAVGQIPTEEVASLPERYGLVASGNLAAAALPNSLLAMGEAAGMKVIADDTRGENISMSVMVATAAFAEENAEAIAKVAQAWSLAATDINANPTEYVTYLVENANLNGSLADSYVVSSYPLALVGGQLVRPDQADVDAVIEWMRAKGYAATDIAYQQDDGAFVEAD